MPLLTTGDLSRHFQSTQNMARVKTRLNTLAQELSSGRVADVSLRLGAGASRFANLEHRSNLIESYQSANRETAQQLSQTQLALGDIQARQSELTEHILSLPMQVTDQFRESSGQAAEQAFEAIVGNLNLSVSGKSLFAGAATNGPALASAEDMMADLRASVAGVTNAADLADAVDTWFYDPAGGFDTMGYVGDRGNPVERNLGDGSTAQIDVRADDTVFRDTLAAAALAALATDAGVGLSRAEADTALRESGTRLLSAAEPLSLAQGKLGRLEAMVETAQARQAAEKTSLDTLRNELVSADPFETAAALQDVQVQLELNFALTARLTGLSMAEYI